MELLFIFVLHGGYENVYFFSYILKGWGAGLLMRKWQSVYITEVYQDYWGLMELLYIYWFFTFYNRELSVQWLYSVYIYELIINGILYNLNEKINQKYTVSFYLVSI